MQTTETIGAKVLPYNDVAELIDREIHARTLEQINVLAREYEIENPLEIAAFLSKNKFLIDLLEEIPEQIRKYFGTDQKIVLQFFLNPEDPSWHQLHVLMPTKLSIDAVSSLTEKFEENWWLENFGRADMKIQILKEYVR